MKPFGQHPDDKAPPKAVVALLEHVETDGGHVLAVYREPVGGNWQAFKHPYVKNYILARTSPLTRARKTVPSFDQAFDKLVAKITDFDVAKVKYEDIQRVSTFAVPAGE